MGEAIEDRILDATERLLARLGYQKTTMDDIAQEAGIGRRTIYLHFPSKEEVALASIDRIVDRLKERLREIARSGGPPGARLRRMLLGRVLFRFDSVRGYHHSIDEIYRALRPAYLARRARYLDEEAALLAEVLAEGRDSGAFDLDDPPATAHTLLLATNALLPTGLSPRELGDRGEVEARASRVADLLLNGLLSRGQSLSPPRPAARRGAVGR